ncbi:hypothetical protein [Neorhizobium galegae]|uniref:hypothetical protein n=1 Tax=Neorhizobium galegae TaxID=399 RepID=UPI000AD5E60D|nr:hypothetical protein [Neorhizobium galegae]MCQ1854180.1 hypothetical protein [Neorhizobium galegae]
MVGATVAKIKQSRHPDWKEGDIVVAYSGWQSHAVSDGSDLRAIDPAVAPISTGLGVLGMTGFTAYAGLRNGKAFGRQTTGYHAGHPAKEHHGPRLHERGIYRAAAELLEGGRRLDRRRYVEMA